MGLSAEKTIFVHDLEADTLVESLFLVEERQEGRTRRGERYLKLRLSDRTGSIEGRVWNGAPGLDVVFRSGDVIAVQARVECWRGALQLNIAHIERAELDISPAAFIPTSRFEPREMLEQLRDLMDEHLRSRWLRRLMAELLYDEALVAALYRSPASKRNHHNVRAGLLEHTLSMVRLGRLVARHYARYYPGLLDGDLLLVGIVLHDVGKVVELSPEPGFAYTTEGELLGHIVSGIGMLDRWLERVEGFPPDLALQLKHMIAAHHGRLEYGSPVRPKLIEAVVLHHIDMIDAQMAALDGLLGAQEDAEDVGWSPYSTVFAGRMMVPPRSGYAWSAPPLLGEDDLDGPGRCWWEKRPGSRRNGR